jgi:hypothetical protein
MGRRREIESLLCRLMMLVDKREWHALSDVMLESAHIDYTASPQQRPTAPIKAATLIHERSHRLGATLSMDHHLASVIVSIKADKSSATASGFATHLRTAATGVTGPSQRQLGCYYFVLALKRTVLGWRIAGIKLCKQWDRSFAVAA